MATQDSIQSSSFGRTAALMGAGAKVSLNYLKHYGQKALTGQADRDSLDRDNASDIYKTFSELKGGPLKVAQMLSIDQNLLPLAYSQEFSQAQYSAPPLSYPLVARTFRREFGQEPLAIFTTFTREAVHGASIGQVHRATRGEQTFAVKVQYPGVADSLLSDLRVIKPFALQMFGLKEGDVAAYFEEVQERLLEETNYELELKRSQEISRSCAHLRHVRFPRYYPEFSSRKVLTMDWVEGVTLDKFADGDASQEARDQVGQALWDFYQYQVHTLRVFHADPHPGNFLVRDDQLWPLDFGCTKKLEEDFYRKQFVFLDPALLEDRAQLVQAMEDLNVLLPNDSAEERSRMVDLCLVSLRLLARPFRQAEFDFGDPEFMRGIYELGEENQQNKQLRSLRGARGSAHSLYVNRTYFGLYSLLSRLRARVVTKAREEEGLALASPP